MRPWLRPLQQRTWWGNRHNGGGRAVVGAAPRAPERLEPGWAAVALVLAGDGVDGWRDGPARRARFSDPFGVAAGADATICVADAGESQRIRAISPDGHVSTIAGSTRGFADGPGEVAQFDTPSAVALHADGTLYVADTGNNAVRRIMPDGTVTTLAGDGVPAYQDGAGHQARFNVTDDRDRIVEITAEGTARTIAGSSPGFRDGAGAAARFRRPAGIAVAAPGRLLVADAGNSLIRLVAACTQVEMRPPASPAVAPQFDDEAFGRVPLLWPAWPMDGPHEVAGTRGEARGGEGFERFHTGIDVRVEQGRPVHAVRDGVVVSPIATGDFGSLNEWLRIGPLTYVHVRAGRTRQGQVLDTTRFVPAHDDRGRVTGIRVKRGARFATGEVVATVNAFNHIHLNVGWSGEEYNPLLFRLTQFEDTIPPAIAPGGVRLFDEAWQPLTHRSAGRILVSGQVRIVVDAWDQADGNRPGRRLGLYALGYQVLHRDGTPAPGFELPLETIRFDRIAGPGAAGLVFAAGSGIPFYGARVTRFLYTVTNTFRGGRAREGYWDTTLHAPGDYILRARATDFHGNAAVANRDVHVVIGDRDDHDVIGDR